MIARVFVKFPINIFVYTASTGDDGGSCTEDDLSGSDQDEMPEQIESDYDVWFCSICYKCSHIVEICWL